MSNHYKISKEDYSKLIERLDTASVELENLNKDNNDNIIFFVICMAIFTFFNIFISYHLIKNREYI
jgi:hypothetical protein